MSQRVYFEFSTGVSRPYLVPHGTLAAIQNHVADVERRLGFEKTQYGDNAPHWRSTEPKEGVTDKELCAVASAHNRFVRWLYDRLAKWAKCTEKSPPKGRWRTRTFGKHDVDVGDYDFFPDDRDDAPLPPETLTEAESQTFWYGLQMIDVAPERWTRDFYVDRMEHVFRVLQGEEHEGVTSDEEPLTPKQAAAAIRVFSEYLGDHGADLEVPNGHCHLAASDDGGYDWCEKCGPMSPDDVGGCRRKACPLLAERDAEEPERARRWVVKDKARGEYLGSALGTWPKRLNKGVRRFADRDAAEAQVKLHAKRSLVVVPVRRW